MNNQIITVRTLGAIKGAMETASVQKTWDTFEEGRDEVNGIASTLVHTLGYTQLPSGRFERENLFFELYLVDSHGLKWFPVDGI